MVNDGYTEITPRVNFTIRAAGDLNGDGLVDINDRNLLRASLGKCEGNLAYNRDADYDNDACVTQLDYQAVVLVLHESVIELSRTISMSVPAPAAARSHE